MPGGPPRGTRVRCGCAGRSCRVAGSRGVGAAWVGCGAPSERRWRRKTEAEDDASLASGLGGKSVVSPARRLSL